MTQQAPSLGRLVHYRLNEQDVAVINERRTAKGIRGNSVEVGDVFPLLVVRMWGEGPEACFNGTVFLDGPDTHWATSRKLGDQPGECFWPPRV